MRDKDSWFTGLAQEEHAAQGREQLPLRRVQEGQARAGEGKQSSELISP